MNITVSKSSLRGTLVMPASKSQSMRALIFGLMGKGKSVIQNLLPSPDIESMILACRHLGAKIENTEKGLAITGISGKVDGSEDVINCGNSGLVLRFIGALAGLSPKPLVLTGDESIRHNRVVTPLLDALKQLGASAFSLRGDEGAPIFVKGPFRSDTATFSGEDSQPVSGMLVAASFAPFPIDLFVVNPGEKPWVEMTLSWLDRLKIPYVASEYTHYKLQGGANYEGFHYTVAGDYSSSAFPIAAALITRSEITLENLDPTDKQGDKKLVEVLQKMGAELIVEEEKRRLTVKKEGNLNGLSIDVNDMIDSIPILAVIGCFAKGETILTGAKIARKKECDRLSAIALELKKMGADIEEREDGLIVRESKLQGSLVQSHHDHRIAMALSIAGLGATGETHIAKTACIAKSYPSFASHLMSLGACLSQWAV